MPRGGKRPGAGAPKGNHNALKTGKYSKRFRDAISTLMNTPEFRAILIAYRKKQIKQHKLANHVVEEALRRYLMKANNLANPLNPYPRDLDNYDIDYENDEVEGLNSISHNPLNQ